MEVSYATQFYDDVITQDVTTQETTDTDCDAFSSSPIFVANSRRMRTHVATLAIVIFLGLGFNTVAFCTFLLSPRLRRTTTARYLIALTVADNTYLIGESNTS